MSLSRIRLASLHDKVISAEQAAQFIENGMTVGMSGFTRAGEAKAVPQALVEHAKKNPLKITLITGASLGNDLDKQLTEAGVLSRRMPFQVDNTLRRAINNGEVMFIDQHLSETVEQMRNQQLKRPDVAVIEAIAITEDGGIIPTTSVGNSASFAIFAEKVIVEINTSLSESFEGLHDIIRHVTGQADIGHRPGATVFVARVAHCDCKPVEQSHGRQVFGQLTGTNQQHAVFRSKSVDQFHIIDAEFGR